LPKKQKKSREIGFVGKILWFSGFAVVILVIFLQKRKKD
jgi:hypothetical protein